jgi:hypothetical protein
MAEMANVELLRRIEELEAQNSELRERADSQATLPIEPMGTSGATGTLKKKRNWAWTALATLLIVIGAILAPFAVVASWAKIALTDTDQFVAAYAPLADDPEVQAYVTSETLLVINQRIDIPQLTSDVIDGITDLGTGPAATQALELLKGPASSGLTSLIETGVSNFVASDAFANVWASALRVSHSQLIALMQNDPDRAVTVNAEGEIGIELGPIVEAAKQALIDRGIDLANQIPAVDRTIVIAQSDALPSVQLAYSLVLSAGAWLPWIAILFLAAGVLVARRRSVALIWAAVALALSMALTATVLGIGYLAFTNAVSPAFLPSSVAGLLYETVAEDMRATTVAVLVLAVVVALVGWLAGPFDVPRRLRGLAGEAAGQIRGAADRRGVTTGRVGTWIYTQRTLLRAAVAVIAAVVILLVRPITPGLVLWTLVLSLIAIAILEIVQRPVITVPANTEEQDPVVAMG